MKTKVIIRLNSATGKNGDETFFSTLNNRSATNIAKTKPMIFKYKCCWFNNANIIKPMKI